MADEAAEAEAAANAAEAANAAAANAEAAAAAAAGNFSGDTSSPGKFFPQETQDEAFLRILHGNRSGHVGGLSTPLLYRALRQIAEGSAAQPQDLATQGLLEWQGRAAGSPTQLMRQFGPQIRQIQDQLHNAFTAVSRRLGPAGGRQVERGQQQALSQSGKALSQLFAGGQQQNLAGFLRFLQQLRPALLTQLPQLTQQENPPNYAALGQALAAGTGLAGQLLPTATAPTIAALNPGYTGFTPAQAAPLSGLNSGYGQFSTYGM